MLVWDVLIYSQADTLGNLYCPFNRGVCLKEVLVPRPLTRYDLKENNIVYFIDYPVM